MTPARRGDRKLCFLCEKEGKLRSFSAAEGLWAAREDGSEKIPEFVREVCNDPPWKYSRVIAQENLPNIQLCLDSIPGGSIEGVIGLQIMVFMQSRIYGWIQVVCNKRQMVVCAEFPRDGNFGTVEG